MQHPHLNAKTVAVIYHGESGPTLGPTCTHWACAIKTIVTCVDGLLIEGFIVDGAQHLEPVPVPAAEYMQRHIDIAEAVYAAMTTPNLYDPELMVRGDDGQGWHPHVPCYTNPDDEEKSITPLLRAQGYESAAVSGEGEAPFIDEVLEEGGDAYWAAMQAWQPTPPDGEGWRLAAVIDTENGPYAYFVRPQAAPAEASA